MFCPQAKAQQQSERLVDSGNKTLKNRFWCTFTGYEGYRLQSREANHIHINTGVRLRSSCIPPVSTVPCGGGIESLWDCNYGWWGSELSAEASVLICPREILTGTAVPGGKEERAPMCNLNCHHQNDFMSGLEVMWASFSVHQLRWAKSFGSIHESQLQEKAQPKQVQT